mgnify:CR=1 FL=1
MDNNVNVGVKSSKSKPGIFRLSDDEKRMQVDRYDSLKLRQSYRGITFILIILSIHCYFL